MRRTFHRNLLNYCSNFPNSVHVCHLNSSIKYLFRLDIVVVESEHFKWRSGRNRHLRFDLIRQCTQSFRAILPFISRRCYWFCQILGLVDFSPLSNKVNFEPWHYFRNFHSTLQGQQSRDDESTCTIQGNNGRRGGTQLLKLGSLCDRVQQSFKHEQNGHIFYTYIPTASEPNTLVLFKRAEGIRLAQMGKKHAR